MSGNVVCFAGLCLVVGGWVDRLYPAATVGVAYDPHTVEQLHGVLAMLKCASDGDQHTCTWYASTLQEGLPAHVSVCVSSCNPPDSLSNMQVRNCARNLCMVASLA